MQSDPGSARQAADEPTGLDRMSIAFLAAPSLELTNATGLQSGTITTGAIEGLLNGCEDRGREDDAKTVGALSAWHPDRTITPPALHTEQESGLSESRHDSVGDGTPYASLPTSRGSSMDGYQMQRPPRPSYSDEQKFFIMYMRIIRDETWPDIALRFLENFGGDSSSPSRSKGGLTSVYYRVRKTW